MNKYEKSKMLREKYLNDIDYEVKLSILSQIVSAEFRNNDSLPHIITITFNTKIILKMNRKWRNSDNVYLTYPLEVLMQVLDDLDLSYDFYSYCQCSAFTYSFEVKFCNPW